MGIFAPGYGTENPSSGKTYCNPIIPKYLADPFILRAGGEYYLYATGRAEDGRFLPIWRSADLVNWSFVRGAVAIGEPGAWNRRNFWAPEVLAAADGRFYLYYTAMPDGTPGNTGNRVGLAVASSPAGPFADRGVVVPHASLDGSPFLDARGATWLFYVAENGCGGGFVAGRIYVDRLLAPDRVAGRPREIVGKHTWQEGPCALFRDGRYWLFYSTGAWGNASYGVRWAVGDSPEGPFTESPDMLMATTDAVKGPGHHNFFRGPDGADWIIYHGWDPAHTARYPRIDPLRWQGGRPTTPGPTASPQPLP